MAESNFADIFKAYDVRGKVGSELTPAVVEQIGKALASWLPKEGAVAIGRDMRPDSAELSLALIKGLVSQGRNVLDIGEVTSDMIYFAAGRYDLAGGAVVTASHNPGEYNGIKFCREEAKPIGEESGLFEIRDLASSKKHKTVANKGSISQKDVTEDWITHVLSFVDVSKLKPLHIAVDAGNGMAGKIFAELEPYVPFDVHEMYFELDGTFPNHIANPLVPENLRDLQAAIKERGCDLGVAFDGDGDRAVLVDEKGEPLTGTVMSALLAKYFLDEQPGSTIILNAICGRAATETVEANGGKVAKSRVGHSFIKGGMRDHNAIFAGEHSGHYYFRDNYMADSGLLAAVIALYIVSMEDKSLSKLVEPYRKAYLTVPEINFEVENKLDVIEKIAKAFPDGKPDSLDGLTINFPYGWINLRPSNTEPLLRFNAEAKTKQQLDKLVDRVSDLVRAA